MATERNQGQSHAKGRTSKSPQQGKVDELEGTTDDGVQVSASLEDTDDGEQSASPSGEEIMETYAGEDADGNGTRRKKGRH